MTSKLFATIKCLATQGAVAQLGERVVRNDEAVGSIPTSSTNPLRYLTEAATLLGSGSGSGAM
jgi:hypothetical protein